VIIKVVNMVKFP